MQCIIQVVDLIVLLHTSEQKSNALKANYTNIGGKLYHDAGKCS